MAKGTKPKRASVSSEAAAAVAAVAEPPANGVSDSARVSINNALRDKIYKRLGIDGDGCLPNDAEVEPADFGLAIGRGLITLSMLVDFPPDLGAKGIDLVHRFLELDQLHRELKSAMEHIGKLSDLVEPKVMAWMVEQGLQNLRAAGRTVSMSRTLWASYVPGGSPEANAENKAKLIKALKKYAPTAPLISEGYNAQQLAAYVRELPTDNEAQPILPKALKPVLSISEKPSLKATK